jgi:hypothetical protein
MQMGEGASQLRMSAGIIPASERLPQQLGALCVGAMLIGDHPQQVEGEWIVRPVSQFRHAQGMRVLMLTKRNQRFGF